MKMFKKLVSVVCAATVLTSSIAFTTSAFSAASVPEEQVAADANLQANVQDGVILHAFNWSYNSIKENLPAIAAAGYSTVQTSPVQQPKDYNASRDVGGQWWKLYQPVSMQIAEQSWLRRTSTASRLSATSFPTTSATRTRAAPTRSARRYRPINLISTKIHLPISERTTSMRTATATPRRSFRVMFPAALTSTQAIPMCRMLSSASSRI